MRPSPKNDRRGPDLIHHNGSESEPCHHLSAALDYAVRGWRVLPCIPRGKRPLLSEWPDRATADGETIRRWWSTSPTANVGIATGPYSGLLVLDLDGEPRALLGDRELPRTPTQRTGGGGVQLFYRFAPELAEGSTTRAGVLPQVDTRGRGGYVVAPPSVHPSGTRYAWCRGADPDSLPLADPPAWLVDALLPRRRYLTRDPRPVRVNGSAYVRSAIERECLALARTPEGARNAALNRAAFNLARFVADGEADPHAVVAALRAAAAHAGLPEREIARTIGSAFDARGVAA
jgi:hypothetical protein